MKIKESNFTDGTEHRAEMEVTSGESPFMLQRYRLRLDHEVMIDEDKNAWPVYKRVEPPMLVEMVVDSMACVPKDQILKMLLEKMERGCFAHWSEKP